jgi:alkaline phosphatase
MPNNIKIFITLTLILSLLPTVLTANEIKNKPKIVILMIADGSGFTHVDAANIYQHGRLQQQVYEQFPIRLAVSTFPFSGYYNQERAWESFTYLKNYPTDSAASATALATGVKTFNKHIGVDSYNKPLTTIVTHAKTSQKSAGLVTSVWLSHATPAAFVAHQKSRESYELIATEMIRESKLDVLMGVGPGMDDTNPNVIKYIGGSEIHKEARKGIIMGADANNDNKRDPWTVIHQRDDFKKLISQKKLPQRVLGIAHGRGGTLQQKRMGDQLADPFVVPFDQKVPLLSEMSLGALQVLNQNDTGFFLMIEGGAIDWASHANQLGRMIEEQISFNNSVASVVKWIEKNSSWDETLLVITADHETGFLTKSFNTNVLSIKPNQVHQISRNNSTKMPEVQWNSDGHTNQLVPIYVKGVGQKYFKEAAIKTDPLRGTYLDNTDIGRILINLIKP